MKPSPRYTREQVRKALGAWLADREADPGTRDDPFSQQAAKAAVNFLLNQARGGYDHYDFTTETQAVRVLEKMVADGKLRKVPRGEAGPDGRRNSTRQPFYYTVAAWQAAEAGRAERMRLEAAMHDRWAAVYDELVRQGHQPVTERGLSVRLSSASWFRLLGLGGD